MRLLRPALVLAACVAASSCTVIYKQDVNQGNLLEQKMVDSLKPGMTRRQVSLILGTPSIASPFDQDRWSYTSSFSKRGRKAEIKTLTLIFEDNLLARIEGDYFPQRDAELLEDTMRYYPGKKMPMTIDKEKKKSRG